MTVASADGGREQDDDFVMINESAAHASSAMAQDHTLDLISDYVDGVSNELGAISLEIHDRPELQYKECHAHDVLTKFMASQKGWTITRSASNIDTAFVAVYDSGIKGPVVSLNAEYGRCELSVKCIVEGQHNSDPL